MAMADQDDLRTEISRMLGAALAADAAHLGEMERRDQLHIGETERRDVLHHDEIARRQHIFDDELESIRVALETRDLIGQAKGIIIASMGCTSYEAYTVKPHSKATQ